ACLAGFGDIAVSQGKLERAAQLMAAVDTQLASTGTRNHVGAVSALGVRLLYIDKIEYERNLSILQSQMDEASFAAAWSKGQMMTLDQAIEFALADMEKQ
ncbi:MAG TPA: hypothetical protein VFK30_01510, partial [Anaerolineae bacterium]|nr:hypothetical protein [Anaerolineae bacterium]